MTSSTRSQFTAASTLILAAAPAYADSTGFTGFYAPDTWTITGAGLGGAAAVFADDGNELTITGFDGGFGSDTDVTHVVVADGNWSFQWSYFSFDAERNFDVAYYLINGNPVYLSSAGIPGQPTTGSVALSVEAGDFIGWRVDSLDGIFGAGVLTITDFRAPVPNPVAFALLGLATLPRARRRR